MVYYLHNDETVYIDEEIKIYDFERSILYKYMKYSFQYVNPSWRNYRSKRRYILFRLGRAVMLLLIWFIIVFGIFYTAETKNITDVDVIFASRIIGIIWQIFNYNLGLYLFYKHPWKIQHELEEIEKLCETNESKVKMQKKLTYCAKHMNIFTILSFITFALVRLITSIVYLIFDGNISLCVVMWIGAGLYRALCLPFLLYFVFIVKLQKIKVDTFTENLESKDLVQQKNDVIKTYHNICNSIKTTAKEYRFFVIFLFAFLCLNGLRITSVISTNITIIQENIHRRASAILYHVTGTIEAVFDVILYAIVLAIASKVSYSQQKVLPAILNHHGERYNVQLDTVTFLKMRHDLEGFGYSISGIPITGMKALVFAAFVMLLGAVGRFFFSQGGKGICFAFTL